MPLYSETYSSFSSLVQAQKKKQTQTYIKNIIQVKFQYETGVAHISNTNFKLILIKLNIQLTVREQVSHRKTDLEPKPN